MDEEEEREVPDTVQRANNRKPRENEDGTFTYIASTAHRDSYGDRIDVKGWELKRFKANPVIPWAHCYSMPPVGKATKVWKDNAGKEMGFPALFVNVRFMKPEDYGDDWPADWPSPKAVESMVRSGYVRGCSVGFRPIKRSWIKEKDGEDAPERITGIHFHKQELLEKSVVPIPANPASLVNSLHDGHLTMLHLPGVLRYLEDCPAAGDELIGLVRKELARPRQFALGASPREQHNRVDQLQAQDAEELRERWEKLGEEADTHPIIVIEELQDAVRAVIREELSAAGLTRAPEPDYASGDLLETARTVGELARSIAGPPGSPDDGEDVHELLLGPAKDLSDALAQTRADTDNPDEE